MLRSFTFALVFLACTSLTQAQFIQNGGFETDSITSNDTIPAHWSADYFGFGFSSDAHSGLRAAEVWNWYSYAKGWISYGTAADPFNGGGQPIAINPEKLQGYYKYIYGSNGGALDSAICEILVYSHQNFTGARDTIAHEIYKLGPQSEYTLFQVPIAYQQPMPIADSILVRFISSEAGFCNPTNECLYLFVDDVDVVTVTGIHQSLGLVPGCNLYPSPSSGGFRLSAGTQLSYPITVELHDLAGRLVFSQTLLSADHPEMRTGLPAGNYVWNCRGSNWLIGSGKIVVE